MPQFADRVKVTTTSTGASDIILSASGVTGYAAVPSNLDGEILGYVIESGSDFEIGTGTYTHSTRRLTRSIRSSSTGSALALSSTNSPHTVFLTPAYQDIQIVEAFSSTSDLPSASANHGRVYHVHGQGALYFAHAGAWVKVANYSDLTTYTHPNHSGEVTSVADGAMTIADDVVDEANLKVSNTPTDGYVLTARSGNTGGMTWESASSGGIALTDLSVTQNAASGTGALAYNNTSGVFSYTPPASSGGGAATSAQIFNEQEFTASAGQTVFTVTNGITNSDNVVVFLNGARLSGSDVTISASANTITLTSSATLSDLVTVTEFSQSFAAAYSSSIFTAGTSSQYNTSTKVLTTNYTVNRVAVFLNGVKLLVNTDCIANNGTTIDLTNAAPVTNDKIEVIEHGDAAAGSGVTTHANKTAIDAVSSPSEGDLAFDEDKNVLYIYAGGAWERVQHGSNVGPRFTTTPASTLALSSGSTSTITAVAVDEAGFPVSYDWDGISGTTVYNSGSLPNQITNVSESNGVFTLTPSNNSAHAGSFNFRIKASDGAQVSTATTAVSLNFSQNINTPNSSPFNAAGTNSLNVTFSGVTHNGGNGFSNTLRQGKYYFEVELTSTNGYQMIGLADDALSSAGNFTSGTFSLYGLGGHFPAGGSTNNHTNVINSGDYYMVAYDTSTREVWMGTNGNWHENPSSASSHLIGSSSTTAFKVMIGSGAGSPSTFTMNFITGGSGTFNSSVPTGFSAH